MSSSSYQKKTTITIDLDGKMLWFLVQTVLVVLKLTGVINGSWWIIWLPTLIPAGAVAAFLLIIIICALASPKFRKLVHEAVQDDEDEEKVEIEINGDDDESSDTSR